uniref:GTP cyclohydrolase 1 feedback regulatory protein n=1 Tax=Meleagris gallopavo TaxID=9103 RepID=G1MVC2_MELGA
MPYLLISTQIRMEVGPTMVGDEHSDPNLMQFLGARKRNMLGNHFWEYYVNDAPRIVLNKLESCGYRVTPGTQASGEEQCRSKASPNGNSASLPFPKTWGEEACTGRSSNHSLACLFLRAVSGGMC